MKVCTLMAFAWVACVLAGCGGGSSGSGSSTSTTVDMGTLTTVGGTYTYTLTNAAGQPVKNPSYKNPLAFNATSNATACAAGYFNCSAFYDPSLYQNRDPNGVGTSGEGNPWCFGTVPRNSSDIRGPDYLTEDFGISKGIPITEKIKADFRAEMFDAFNRHIFDRPNSDLNVSNVSVGQIGGLQNGPRNVQFHLRITC